jgi:short-subunit dehydrogenase
MQLQGTRAVIVGGSSGIGLAIAAELCRRGSVVALVGRDPARLDAALEQLQSPAAALDLVCDVTDERAVELMIRDAVRLLGRIDVLVNCAGQGVRGPARCTTLEDARSLMETNYLGAVRTSIAVLPEFVHQGAGVVVNVASVAGLYGVPGLAAYGASKAALVTFGQALRAEVAASGIRIINVYPDYTETPFFAREKQVGGARPPRGRYATARSVARRIVRAMEGRRDEVVLSARGRLLRVLGGLWPALVDRLLRRLSPPPLCLTPAATEERKA